MTVDGRDKAFAFDAGGSVLRVPDLRKAPDAAPGTTVCVTLAGACSTLASLCKGAAASGTCRCACVCVCVVHPPGVRACVRACTGRGQRHRPGGHRCECVCVEWRRPVCALLARIISMFPMPDRHTPCPLPPASTRSCFAPPRPTPRP